jgi:hypothetical protein
LPVFAALASNLSSIHFGKGKQTHTGNAIKFEFNFAVAGCQKSDNHQLSPRKDGKNTIPPSYPGGTENSVTYETMPQRKTSTRIN